MSSNTSRIIYYYDLSYYNIQPEETKNILNQAFEGVKALSLAPRHIRFLDSSGGLIAMQGITNIHDGNRLQGRLIKIRTENFPEIMNMTDDQVRDIDITDDDGLLEVNHFIIDYTYSLPLLAFEYNKFGANVMDLCKYVDQGARNKGFQHTVIQTPIIRDDLNSYKERMQRCKIFTARVHKDNISRIQELDDDLYTAMKISQEYGDSEYAEIELKFDLKNHRPTTRISNKISALIDSFRQRPQVKTYFDALDVYAEDEDQANTLEIFDLISHKVKSKVDVQRRGKTRAILSQDIYDKLNQEIDRQFRR